MKTNDPLTLLFIGLKLTGYIDWSWIWVLSPLWISGIIVVVSKILLGSEQKNRMKMLQVIVEEQDSDKSVQMLKMFKLFYPKHHIHPGIIELLKKKHSIDFLFEEIKPIYKGRTGQVEIEI